MTLRKFTAEDFEIDHTIDLMSHLIMIPHIPGREKGVEFKELNRMSPEEIRSEFAKRLNDGRLTFSTYTMNKLQKRLKQ